MAALGDGEEKKAGKNKHGFPHNFRFMLEDQELLVILDDKLHGAPLDRALDAVFHDTRILDFHPAKLYGMYTEDEANGYIYFFSMIEFKAAKPKKWSRSVGQGGRWKAVLGSRRMVEVGGVIVSRKLTMEFYVKGVTTNWGMHEFVRITAPTRRASLIQRKIIGVLKDFIPIELFFEMAINPEQS
uniref:NAC domain-containing protein n=1 Tax=Oryza punctata TaxID=4537 RepID=A0A0E0LLD4_ORYPU